MAEKSGKSEKSDKSEKSGKSSENSGKSSKKSGGASAWLAKLFRNTLIASVVLLVVFILGELFAFYSMRYNNTPVLWLPVFLLVVVLFYKVLD